MNCWRCCRPTSRSNRLSNSVPAAIGTIVHGVLVTATAIVGLVARVLTATVAHAHREATEIVGLVVRVLMAIAAVVAHRSLPRQSCRNAQSRSVCAQARTTARRCWPHSPRSSARSRSWHSKVWVPFVSVSARRTPRRQLKIGR